MTKHEYLHELEKYLKHLPKEDYDHAMDYVIEYIDDVGEDKMDEVIAALGTPKEAATELVGGILDKQLYSEDDSKSKPTNIWKYVGVAALALLAVPIGLPLLLVALALILAGVMTAAALFAAGASVVVATFVGAIKLFVRGVLTFTVSIPGALIQLGMALVAIGLCVLLALAIFLLCTWLARMLVLLVKKIIDGRHK